MKNLLRRLDGEAVLANLAALPMYEWSSRAATATVRHFEPTADAATVDVVGDRLPGESKGSAR